MLASHNTFTYLKSSIWLEIFSIFWRCQNIAADKQTKDYHIEVCDIRVNYNGKKWRLCHGKASFGPTTYQLRDLIYWCLSFGFTKYRLLYERKNIGYSQFIKEWSSISSDLTNKCICCIYNPDWVYLYGDSSNIIEHNKHVWYKENNVFKNIKNFFSSTIKSYARKHNKRYEDSSIHMYDYIQYIN